MGLFDEDPDPNAVDPTLPTATSAAKSPAPGQSPEIRRNASDIEIPAITWGTAEKPPGALAAHIKRLDYSVAHSGDSGRLTSEALAFMSLMPAQRDLVLRPNVSWMRVILERTLNSRIENIESALLQVVGLRAEHPCVPCQRGYGPWSLCVVLEGKPDFTACATCHFRGNDSRCTHYQPPPDRTESPRQGHTASHRTTEINISRNRTRREIEVLRQATGGNTAADETRQRIAVVAEGLKLQCQQLSHIRAHIELLQQHNRELQSLCRNVQRLQREEAVAAAAAIFTDARGRHSRGHRRR
ncbi:hypothetical protein N7517_010984 [Penicillium concentricum]|uniref:Uncharacterized protein n=1 Tax=Penicillium concentricum TaxID=293559 RepID=A0A9W9R9W7_9EURO|nr:uncharacterized protein N7517_010984 [Penicillium concentricum]KAJ5356375.1 hypothetical protein N7517_010984 [Penicillium concentricum]